MTKTSDHRSSKVSNGVKHWTKKWWSAQPLLNCSQLYIFKIHRSNLLENDLTCFTNNAQYDYPADDAQVNHGHGNIFFLAILQLSYPNVLKLLTTVFVCQSVCKVAHFDSNILDELRKHQFQLNLQRMLVNYIKSPIFATTLLSKLFAFSGIPLCQRYFHAGFYHSHSC